MPVCAAIVLYMYSINKEICNLGSGLTEIPSIIAVECCASEALAHSFWHNFSFVQALWLHLWNSKITPFSILIVFKNPKKMHGNGYQVQVFVTVCQF